MELDDFLAHAADMTITELYHHGVKGMHWGVHQQRRLEVHTRVANGTGSKLDKLKAFNEMSAIDLARHKGNVQSFSKQRAAQLLAQRTRSETGKSTKLDKLSGILSVTGEDVARKALNKPRARKV